MIRPGLTFGLWLAIAAFLIVNNVVGDTWIAATLSVRAVEDAVRARNDGNDPDAKRTVTGRLRPPGLLELEELLSDRLETRVKMRLGAGGKGTLAIEFAGLDDLERIYRRMTNTRDANVASA